MSDSKFSALRLAYRASRSAQSGPTGQRKSASSRQRLEQAASFEEARALVYGVLAVKIADVLMKDVEEVSPTQPMVSYGLDSLVAVEVRNWITRELDVRVSMFDLISGNSLDLLAVVIVLKSKAVSKQVKEEYKEE